MRKFDLSLRSSRSSYFATFRHQLTILSKTDALDEEKWLNMSGTFVKDWFRYESHFVHGRDSLVDILKERELLSESVFFSSIRRHTRLQGDWSSDVCSSDLAEAAQRIRGVGELELRRGDYPAARTALQEAVAIYGRTGPLADALAVRRELASALAAAGERSEERRVGKEGRCRGSPEH